LIDPTNLQAYDTRLGYTVVLKSEPDGGFVVYVPALPGCVSQGDTREEALDNIREAAELWVEACREAGRPLPSEADIEFVEMPRAG
jgi:predicted RNase H-like HicB family nuclease